MPLPQGAYTLYTRIRDGIAWCCRRCWAGQRGEKEGGREIEGGLWVTAFEAASELWVFSGGRRADLGMIRQCDSHTIIFGVPLM